MEESEWHEFTISPDDIHFTESGDLIVRSERIKEALEQARAQRQPPPSSPNIVVKPVTVRVGVSIKP